MSQPRDLRLGYDLDWEPEPEPPEPLPPPGPDEPRIKVCTLRLGGVEQLVSKNGTLAARLTWLTLDGRHAVMSVVSEAPAAMWLRNELALALFDDLPRRGVITLKDLNEKVGRTALVELRYHDSPVSHWAARHYLPREAED